MAKQTINTGTGELAGDGDTIRAAFTKVNANFDEVYAGGIGGGSADTGDITFAGTQIIGDGDGSITSVIDIVPDVTALAGDYPDDYLRITRDSDGGYIKLSAGPLGRYTESETRLVLGSDNNYIQIDDSLDSGEIRAEISRRDFIAQGDYASEAVANPENYGTFTGYEYAEWTTNLDGDHIITFYGTYQTQIPIFLSIGDLIGEYGNGAVLLLQETIDGVEHETVARYINVGPGQVEMYVTTPPPVQGQTIDRFVITTYNYYERNFTFDNNFTVGVNNIDFDADDSISITNRNGGLYVGNTIVSINGSSIGTTVSSYTSGAGDYTNASWFTSNGAHYIRYTASAGGMANLAFAFGDGAAGSNIVVFDDVSQSNYTLTYGGGTSNLGGLTRQIRVDQAPPLVTPVISSIVFTIGTTQDSTIDIDRDLEINVPGAVTIRTNASDSNKTWIFQEDGKTVFPNNTIQTGSTLTFQPSSDLRLQTLGGNVFVQTNSIIPGDPSGGFNQQWSFDLSGMMKFPSNEQFSVVAPPTTSRGQPGDVPGMIAFDINYIYRCVNAYIDGDADIWRSVQLSSTPW